MEVFIYLLQNQIVHQGFICIYMKKMDDLVIQSQKVFYACCFFCSDYDGFIRIHITFYQYSKTTIGTVIFRNKCFVCEKKNIYTYIQSKSIYYCLDIMGQKLFTFLYSFYDQIYLSGNLHSSLHTLKNIFCYVMLCKWTFKGATYFKMVSSIHL